MDVCANVYVQHRNKNHPEAHENVMRTQANVTSQQLLNVTLSCFFNSQCPEGRAQTEAWSRTLTSGGGD